MIGDAEGASSNPDEGILLNFVQFLLFRFLTNIFPFGLFPFILTPDPLKLREDFAITYF